nr:restriction endonuclease subunit R [Verrucomicrobiota bacterium]
VNDLPHTSHADQLVRICRETLAQGDDFVKKITGNQNVDRPLQRIREFRNRPNPKIVVTVDMLSTGVDIPALEFIVFLRPVKSRILWEQMLGRGTRRCDEINKTKFVVFDCFDGTLLRYFRDVSNFQIEEPRADPLSIPELIENIWQNIDRDYHVRLLVKRLRRIEKDMSGDAREQFTRWMPDGDVGRFAGELTARLRDNFTDTMRLLRTPAFQQLLTDYPRAKRLFIIAHEAQDTVSSQLVERYGPFPSAEDYLGAFSAFVRNKAHEIEALRILISKPEGWNPDALVTLRRQLNENGFDEKTLRRAHERVHRKALADLISMIKHAAREVEPLLTAAERVAAALAEIRAFHTFTPEQSQWFDHIGRHLVENLCIDTEDLNTQPVFTKHGGLARARRVFGDQLPLLIERLNYTLAA